MRFNFTKIFLVCIFFTAFGSISSGQLLQDQIQVRPMVVVDPVMTTALSAGFNQNGGNKDLIPAVSPKENFVQQKPTSGRVVVKNSKKTTSRLDLKEADQASTGSSYLLSNMDVSADADSKPKGALFIPKLSLSSNIVDVPVVDNAWQVADLGQGVGRLEGSGRFPQDEKAMVLAAHATTFWPIRGPFFKLDHLLPNDEFVYIYNQQKYVYQVSRLFLVEPDQTSLLNNDNGNQIILVTCGQYNYYKGRFERRLVVVADLIDIQPIQSGLLTD